MSALKKLKEFVRSVKRGSNNRLDHLQIPLEVVAELRKELGLGPDDKVEIDGVPVIAMTEREMWIAVAMQFALVRWHVSMTRLDAETLLKAVPTDELADLIPIVVNQQMDDHDMGDPIDEMTEYEVGLMRKQIEEMRLVDPTV